MHTPGGYTINKNIPVDSCRRVVQPKKKKKHQISKDHFTYITPTLDL